MGTNGQYIDSVEEIDAVANGAQAVQGQHQVWWAANANTPTGAVFLTTPDGKQLSSSVICLAYYDPVTGSNAAISYVQDSIGSIIPPNQVLYTNAFSNLNASIQYTYTKSGLSQDILLNQAPPAPDRYGLSDDTATLQIYTQFFNPPESEATAVTNGNSVDDQILSFGQMQMGVGEALFINGQDAPVTAGVVSKQWSQISGNTYLIESIPYATISNQLQQLPQASNLKPGRGSIWRTASLNSKPHVPARQAEPLKPMKHAKAEFASPRLVVDYNLSGTSNNCTLQGDTTYYVSGTFNVTGTLTIEGGAVVKYTNSGPGYEIEATNFVCDTGPYRPAIFTSMDDNSVGTPMGSGHPTRTSDIYLNFQSLDHPITLRHLRFSHANSAIIGNLPGTNSLTIWDCQFFNCGVALSGSAVQANGNIRAPIYVYNSLISECATALDVNDIVIGGSAGGAAFDVINATVDDVGTFTASGINNVCYVTNSIFTGVTTLSGITLSDHCSTNSSGTGIYQTAGAGSYYLADASTNQGAGTTNIDTNLLADLQIKTTYPPITNLTGWLMTSYTFAPTNQRDNAGGAVDRGYHYDPIDYAVDLNVSNAAITILPGTVIAGMGQSNGICLNPTATCNCTGTATDPNYIVRYNTVQEQSNTNWESTSWAGAFIALPGGSNSIFAKFRFTDWSELEQGWHFNVPTDNSDLLPYDFQDCEFYNGDVGWTGTTVDITNCLFQRTVVDLEDYGNTVSNVLYNNFFWNGELVFAHNYEGLGDIWTMRDNLFDRCSIPEPTCVTNDISSNNAYVTTNNGVLIPTNAFVVLPGSPVYQSGDLGSFYYPTNLTQLIHNGSRSATNAGLYHYTVLTNNTIEGTNTVSIGFHYVACGTDGLPLVSNPAGIPDYLADANGDGIVDDGETPWDWGISSQPLSTNVVQGQNATFSVTATGVAGIGPFTYQWQSNGNNIAGANSSTFTLWVVQTNDAATYSVLVTNSGYPISSSNAVLSVIEPISITSQPADQTVAQGATATFSVGASGNYLDYQWLSNGIALSGMTSSVLTLSNVVTSDEATYTVVISNLWGNVTSSPAILTVITNIVVTSDPTNVTAIQADDVTFSIGATTGDGVGYQWWFTNATQTNSIAGATNTSYTQLVVQTNDDGYYSVDITNLAGSTNASAQLTVVVPPWITQYPTNITAAQQNSGSGATFSVSAIGTTNLIYQWYKLAANGTTSAISGKTNSSFNIALLPNNAAGYGVLVTNNYGTNFSGWAWLSIIASGGGTTNFGWGTNSNPPSAAPVVLMIKPTNNAATNPAVYPYGTPISIRATAYSLYSDITNVAFYYTGTNGSTNYSLAGTAVPGSNGMFALAWTNAFPGTNVIKARAWDSTGASNDSSVVYVLMTQPPSISAGANITNYWTTAPASTNIQLNGSIANDGQPYQVTNINWSVLSGSGASISSGANTLTPTIAVTTNGIFTFKLEVDNDFATNTSTCTVILNRDQLYFNSPTNGSTFVSGTPFVLNVTALSGDAGSRITGVQFYNGTTNLGSGIESISNTFTFAWYDAPIGTNLVSAISADNYGFTNIATETVVVVPPPSLEFISPTNAELFVFSPTNIYLTVQPMYFITSYVTSVVFSNQFTNLGTATPLTNSQFQLLWQFVTNGNYTITATAIDNYGNAITNSVAITVNAMPVCTISIPTNLILQITNVTITATNSDSDGTITNVTFYKYTLGTNNILASYATSGSSVVTNAVWSNLTAGAYPVVAEATDNRGATTMSAIKIIEINPLPYVNITYPTNDQVFVPSSDITITATAYGTNGGGTVTNVEFFVNSTDIGGASEPPYSITECCWKPGTYIITAEATDNAGLTGYTNIQITIASDAPAAQGFWDAQFGMTLSELTGSYAYVAGAGIAHASDGTLYLAGPWNFLSSKDETTWTNIPNPFIAGEAFGWSGIMVNGTNVYGEGYPENAPLDGAFEWDGGTNWQAVGNGLSGGFISGMASIGGDIYIIGDFSYAGGTNTNVQAIAKLNAGSNVWEPVGNGIANGFIYAIAALGNNIYIGGSFTNAGNDPNANFIAELVGTNWTNVGAGISCSDLDNVTWPVYTLAACGSNLFVGGEFDIVEGNTNAHGIAVWNGATWNTMNGGPGPSFYYEFTTIDPPFDVFTISPYGNRVFVGGAFTNVLNGTNSITANSIAMATWNDSDQTWTWSDLDAGVGPFDFGYVLYSLVINGVVPDTYDLYISGTFDSAGSGQITSPNVARWRVGYLQPPSIPQVTITWPQSPYTVTNNGALTNVLTGLTVSKYTDIQSATIYVNGTALWDTDYPTNSTNAFAFTNDWINPSPGLYLVTATAIDNSNLIGESEPVVVNVKSTNNPITARDDVFTIPVGTLSTNLQVLANDSPTSGLKISGITTLHGDLGTASISYDGNYVIYAPFPNAYGTDIFFYTVTNGVTNDSASVTLNILAPPQVSITNLTEFETVSNLIPVSGTSIAVGSGNSITNVTLYCYSSNSVNFASESTNAAFSFSLTNTNSGWYNLVAVASDTNGSATASTPLTVILTNSSTTNFNITAAITNLNPTYATEDFLAIPNDPVITNGIFDLRGQASASGVTGLVTYQVLLYQPIPGLASAGLDVGDEAATYVADSPLADITPGPTNNLGFHIGGDASGDLGSINLTGFPNGTYELVLQVRDGDEVTNTIAEFQLDSQLKIGQFSFSQQDVILPVSGIPITITRTYNSMSGVNADFGYDWTFAINSMNIQLDDQRENLPVGSGQLVPWDGGGSPGSISVRTGGGWDVTITLPDGRTAVFQAVFPQATGYGFDQPYWQAPPGVNYTLTDPHNDTFYGLNNCWNNVSGLAFENFDIPSYLLTDNTTGVQYNITRGSGMMVPFDVDGQGSYVYAQVYGVPELTGIVQPSGDTIAISSNSIAHYAPGATSPSRSLSMVRDGQGRIIAVYDPNSTNAQLPTVQYVYDQADGNLIQVLKLVNAATGVYTTNFYDYNNPNFPHYITSMENGDGVTVIRNFYDSTGRLIETEDPNGNFTQFIHNLANTTEMVVDPLGHTNSYVYDGNGDVLSQTNALGQVTTMAYDANNNKTNEITWLNGSPYATNRYVYDTTLNLPLSSTDPLGRTTTYTYNSIGEIVTTTDPRNYTSTNLYDESNGNLITNIDALGHATVNSYDSGMIVGTVDPLGNITTNVYDSNQNLTSTAVLSSSGIILSSNTYTYDLDGNRLTSTIWRHVGSVWVAATTTNIYDAQSRVVETIDPEGGSNSIAYDGAGRQIQTTDQLGRSTYYQYDYMGRLAQTTYPDGTFETSAYDAAGNRTNSADRLGRITSYQYDALNRLTNTIFPDTNSNSTVYDGVGRVATNIDALGTVTGYAYDVAGQRLAVTNAYGTPVAMTNLYTYDNDGNQATFTDSLGRVTTNVYDALNRQLQTLYPDGTQTGTDYDADGRKIAQTNQDNLVTWFAYDGAGRLIAVTNALSQVTRYDYDEAGNEIHQIDALNRTNVYLFDNLNRQVQHFLPGGQATEFVYDLVGNLIYQTNGNGVVLTNQYDSMNRLTNEVSSGGFGVIFAYSATGQRTNMVDGSGTNEYLYDGRDRLTNKMVLWSNGPSVTLSYTYDSNGNVSAIWSSTSSGVDLVYNYDALNRLTNVEANGSAIAISSFDTVGNLSTTRYGTVATNTYQYDRINRLTNLVCTTVNGVVGSFYYQLSLTGNRTNLSETVNSSSRTYQWQHDPIYRLTNENIGGFGVVTNGYDPVANRTNRTSMISGLSSQSFAFNTNDWLTSDTYDASGNTTSSGGTNYGYDALNRLTNANNGGTTITFTYDGDGNRASKTIGGTTTWYLLDDRNPSGYVQVLEEHQGTNLTRVYNYGLTLISQRQEPSGTVSYYGFDGHDSTRFLLNSSGGITDAYTYDAYGSLIASSGSTPNNYLYCGQQYDPDLGYYFNRARILNQNVGRFLTMDSYQGEREDPLSLHKYLYCEANPVNLLDRSGNDGESLDVDADFVNIGTFQVSLSQIQLTTSKIVVVCIFADSVNAPSTFNAQEVAAALETQLNASVFNNLVAGSVHVQIIQGVRPAAVGWQGPGKSRYYTHVEWNTGNGPFNADAISDNGETTIYLGSINQDYAHAKGNIGLQLWVNTLAHESIWINAGGNNDPSKFGSSVPPGDIHSGSQSLNTPFTVQAASRSTLIKEFGFTAAQ
jgi:RHS repeat-associated protein